MRHPLLRGRWIARHLIVLSLVVSFVELGLWQVRRFHVRRAANAVVTARLAIPVRALDDVVSTPDVDPDAFTYRRVFAEGTFDSAHEVILPDRSYKERAGNEVVTPLVLKSGRAVIVNRGWVPLDFDEPPLQRALPPTGNVRVTGVLFGSQKRGRFGPQIAPTGELKQFFRIDLPRLQEQSPFRIYPLYLQELSQEPAQRTQYPIAESLPKLDEGPHLSYAIQWFSFAAIALAGYTALLRKNSR